MRVLLSWSGSRSKTMAAILRDWLPNVIQSADPWMSESDIDIGSRWGPDLDKELEKSNFGILCLTPENMESTWIHYEAGALSKFVDKTHVCPYLLNLQPTDVKGPLVSFQMAKANKEDTLKLVQTINRSCIQSDKTLSEERVSTIFEKFWPDLEADLEKIPSETRDVIQPSRSFEDISNEILKIVREQAIISSEILKRMAFLQNLPKKFTKGEFPNSGQEPRDPDNFIRYSDFIKNHTKYKSLDDLLDDARRYLELDDGSPIVIDKKFNAFLSENTDFSTWDQLNDLAIREYNFKTGERGLWM